MRSANSRTNNIYHFATRVKSQLYNLCEQIVNNLQINGVSAKKSAKFCLACGFLPARSRKNGATDCRSAALSAKNADFVLVIQCGGIGF